MRPSATTGDAQALPGTGVFQRTFLVSLHSSGSRAVVRPSPCGPRNWFHGSSAGAVAAASSTQVNRPKSQQRMP